MSAPSVPTPSRTPAVVVDASVARPPEPPPTETEVEALVMERQRLAASGQLDAAEALCARWIDRGNAVARAEGYKCSANVLVARGKDVGDTLMILR